MELTEIRITLGTPEEQPLCGYCSVTFDHCFVVHDLRILKQNDRIFVAMPSRKRMVGCPFCRQKNAVQSRFCNNCGRGLKNASGSHESVGRLYNDVAHPVNSDFREQLEQAVLDEYQRVINTMKQNPRDSQQSHPSQAANIPPGAPHFVRTNPNVSSLPAPSSPPQTGEP